MSFSLTSSGPSRPVSKTHKLIAGGFVQFLDGTYEGKSALFLMDEEGKANNNPINVLTTDARKIGVSGPLPWDYVAGDMLVPLGATRWK